MRQISYWAKDHPLLSRLFIVFSRCLLLWIACFLGAQVAIADMEVSPLWNYVFICLFLAACYAYPLTRTAANYTKRKRCELVVCVSGFLLTVCLVAQLHHPGSFYQSLQATVPIDIPSYKYPEAQKLLEQFKSGEKTDFTRKEKRIIRKEFNYQLVRYAKAKIVGNKNESGSAGLIILACIAAVGLLFLVLSLACTLSCNGSDAGAIMVGLIGTAAIVWGLIALIRSIRRKKQKAQESPTQ